MAKVWRGLRPSATAGGALAACLGVSALGASLIAFGAFAAPIASGQVVRDFTRITFEWAQPTTLQTRMEGNKLVVTFDRRASDPDFSRLLTRLPNVVRSASLGADGRTVTLTLDKSYRTRSFVSGRLTGVDLLGTEDAATPEVMEEAVKPAPQKLETKTSEAKTAAKKPAPASKPPAVKKAVAKAAEPKPPVPSIPSKARIITAPPSTPVPKATAAPVPKVAVTEEKQAAAAPPPVTSIPAIPVSAASAAKPDAPKPDAPKPDIVAPEAAIVPPPRATEPQEPLSPPPPAQEAASVSAVPKPAAVPVPQENKPILGAVPVSAPTTQPQRIVLQRSTAPALAIQTQAAEDQVVLRFPFVERTAAAAFARGDALWLVFDRPAALNVDSIKDATLVRGLEQLAHPSAIVLRLSTLGLKGVRLQRAPEGQGWDAVLSPRLGLPSEPLIVQPKTDTPLKPYLLVNALETSPPVDVTDPVVGDVLRIAPSYAAGQGIAPGRDYVEMELLPSAQGVVIASHGPDIGVVTQRNGLRLSAEAGLRLSPGLPSVPAGKEETAETAHSSLFAREEMAAEHGQTLRSMEQDLFPLLLNPGALADAARLRLAQAYLAEGLSAEALGMLSTLRDANLDGYIRERASAYAGLANFLMGRMPEVARDFGTPELQGNEEMDAWRTLLAELTGQSDELIDYPRFNARYLRQYPKEVRRRIGVVTIDRLVARNRYNEALVALDGMKKDGLDRDDAPTAHAMDFFTGEILARTGYPDKAEKLWKNLNEDVDDRYWRARANFARINLNLAQKKITEEEAMPQLDALRILWRDDPLELQVLKQLGEMQIRTGKYRDGLRTLKEITTAYPNTEDAFKAAQSMAETFVMLFNGDGAKTMKPLDALTLYYEFKDLTPVEAEGDLMIRNLADRLAEVDLLDRAAALLDHQVQFRLQGEERSRVGARLALIYLLDRKPQQALDVMERTGFGGNSVELQQKRDLLTARALADLKEGARAVKLLEDDGSLDANLLKLDIAWDIGDWKNVGAVAEGILSQRPDPTKALTEPEMGALLKLALAYSFEKDTDQLHYLRDYFGPLVKENPHKDLFAFLTSDTPVTPQSIAQMAQTITQMQSFLSRYRSQVKEEGLSEAVK